MSRDTFKLVSLGSKLWLRFLLAALIGLCTVPIGRLSPVQKLEDALYDLRVSYVADRRTPDPRILIVAIDDTTLMNENAPYRWPWPRSVLAELLGYCSEADTVGVALVLPEGTMPPDISVSNFSDEIRVAERMVGAMIATDAPVLPGRIQEDFVDRFAARVYGREWLRIPSTSHLLQPSEEIVESSTFLGFLNDVSVDGQSSSSRFPLFVDYNENVFPSFALALFAQYKENNNLSFYVEGNGTMQGKGLKMAVTPDSEFLMVYHRSKYNTISASDILTSIEQERAYAQLPPETEVIPDDWAPKVSRDTFHNKIVLIGSTASSLRSDFRNTPLIGQSIPGVELQAMALDNLLNGEYFTLPPPWVIIVVCVLLALPAWMVYAPRPQLAFLNTLLVALFYAAISILLSEQGLVLPVVTPLLSCIFSVVAFSAYQWDLEQRQVRRLLELDKAKQQFTDMLVHDLKGQVGNLTLSMDLLKMNLPDGGEDPMIETMDANARRMLAQIHSLLDIRRIEEGKMPLSLGDQGIKPLVDKVVEEHRPSAKLVGLEIEVLAPKNQSVLGYVDADVLSRILSNLLLNAIQYAEPRSTIRVKYYRKGGEVMISVTNDGGAIPDSVLRDIFTPFKSFAQEHKNTRAVSTGLGLAFCKLAVEAHGGHIEIVSPLPKKHDGVLVSIHLPLRDFTETLREQTEKNVVTRSDRSTEANQNPL